MASNKGVELDNIYVMNSNDAINLINSFFSNELPLLGLKKNYNDPSGYWGVKYGNDSTDISIESGRGILEWRIAIDNSEIELINFDDNVKNVKVSSKKNIEFILNLMKHTLQRL